MEVLPGDPVNLQERRRTGDFPFKMFAFCSSSRRRSCWSASGSWWRWTRSGSRTPWMPACTSDPPSSGPRSASSPPLQLQDEALPDCSGLCPAFFGRGSTWKCVDLRHRRPGGTLLQHGDLQPGVSSGRPFVCQSLERRGGGLQDGRVSFSFFN